MMVVRIAIRDEPVRQVLFTKLTSPQSNLPRRRQITPTVRARKAVGAIWAVDEFAVVAVRCAPGSGDLAYQK